MNDLREKRSSSKINNILAHPCLKTCLRFQDIVALAHLCFKTCLRFQDNWDNDQIATSFKINFCYKEIYESSASRHHTVVRTEIGTYLKQFARTG